MSKVTSIFGWWKSGDDKPLIEDNKDVEKIYKHKRKITPTVQTHTQKCDLVGCSWIWHFLYWQINDISC